MGNIKKGKPKIMAELKSLPEGAASAATGMQTFEFKEYDVTSYWESGCGMLWTFGLMGWTRKQLTLDPDEAVLKTDNCCCHSVQKRPYAQLGSVDSSQACGCCWGVKSDITGAEGEISPGCGCQEALVKEIIAELQARKLGRGNVAQLKAQGAARGARRPRARGPE